MTGRLVTAFVTPSLRPIRLSSSSHPRMSLRQPGRIPVAAGSAILSLLLTNRLIAPLSSLTPQQSRADLIGVATAATLLLYGLTRLDITPTNEPVLLDGTNIRQGFSATPKSREIEWALQACLRGAEHVQSVALIGGHSYFLGRFREGFQGDATSADNGIVAGALQNGDRVYLADMKVVAAKEVEFGYLPEKVQAVLVLPIGTSVLVMGANKPRPFKGVDFGWIQAIADRIGTILEGGVVQGMGSSQAA